MPPRPPTIRQLLPPPSALTRSPTHYCQKRTFLSSLLSSATTPSAPQTLTASRRLPYDHKSLYTIIADIDSYSAFLPYCSSSRVTSWTPTPDPEFGRRWPTKADLTAGWGGLEQTYTSRVFCVPGSVVEALSGEGARSGIAKEVLARYGLEDEPLSDLAPGSGSTSTAIGRGASASGSGGQEGEKEEGVFKTLVTRWTVTPVEENTRKGNGEGAVAKTGAQREWSDVHLSIRFQFANPLYGAVSSAIADKIAPIMIEAFVERAKKVLG
ncbi:hypothetical protein F5Y19DRAFT_287648 [Xylariaceae sp. FL1651]|nr:hypothetical protein F5Y19DRAFT_287648 [Xylariaceae sp. FL1651]